MGVGEGEEEGVGEGVLVDVGVRVGDLVIVTVRVVE